MGAAGSTITIEHLTAENIGDYVANLGEKFQSYRALIIENGVDGTVINSVEQDDLKNLMMSIGVQNVAHQTVIISHFKKLKAVLGRDNSGGTQSGNASAHNPDCCQFHPLPNDFEVGSQVTQTPRSIMVKLFEIQGIAVDPTDLEPAVDKIAKAVGSGFGDGKSHYDCFINYRVAADADLAEKLYLYLANKGIYAFLDKKCLKNGEKWKEGFLTGN